MFIRIFCHNYWPDNRVTSIRISQMVKIWQALDPLLEVEVVCTRPFFPDGRLSADYRFRLLKRESIDGVNVVRLWSVVAPNAGVIRRSASFVTYCLSAILYGALARRADVVLGSSPQLLAATAAAVVGRVRQVPCVVEVRDLWPESIGAVFGPRLGIMSAALHFAAKFTYKSASLLAVVTHSFEKCLREYLHSDAPFFFAPNGFDFGVDPLPIQPLKPSSKGTLTIGYIGTVGLAHGLETVLEAAALLRARGFERRVRFLIVGQGADRARLARIIAARDLNSLVELKDSVPHREIASAYADVDLSLVMLKRTEAFTKVLPSKMFECMAFRKPILLGVEGESLEVLRVANAGCAFTPEDPMSLADVVQQIVEGKLDLRGMGDNGYAFAKENFDRQKIAKGYLEAIKGLVATQSLLAVPAPDKRALLYVLRDSRYFVGHRLRLALAAKAAGYRVAVACDDYGDGTWETIAANGIERYKVPFLGRRLDPLRPLRCIAAVSQALSSWKPTLVHAITVQSVLAAGLLCLLRRIPFVALVAGRGSIYEMTSMKGALLRRLIDIGYWLFSRNSRAVVVFMNPVDMAYFVSAGLVPAQRCRIIRGSGVDTQVFDFASLTLDSGIGVLLAARLYREKGVLEFAAAASRLRNEFPKAKFAIAGDIDPMNPTSFSHEEVRALCADGNIEWLGFQKDMKSVLHRYQVYCLPSYHEGLPLSLLEAAATGRILVATDIPGCREVVQDGKTGVLVQPRSSQDLTEKLRAILTAPENYRAMAEAAHLRAEQQFSLPQVNRAYLELYNELEAGSDLRN